MLDRTEHNQKPIGGMQGDGECGPERLDQSVKSRENGPGKDTLEEAENATLADECALSPLFDQQFREVEATYLADTSSLHGDDLFRAMATAAEFVDYLNYMDAQALHVFGIYDMTLEIAGHEYALTLDMIAAAERCATPWLCARQLEQRAIHHASDTSFHKE